MKRRSFTNNLEKSSLRSCNSRWERPWRWRMSSCSKLRMSIVEKMRRCFWLMNSKRWKNREKRTRLRNNRRKESRVCNIRSLSSYKNLLILKLAYKIMLFRWIDNHRNKLLKTKGKRTNRWGQSKRKMLQLKRKKKSNLRKKKHQPLKKSRNKSQLKLRKVNLWLNWRKFKCNIKRLKKSQKLNSLL